MVKLSKKETISIEDANKAAKSITDEVSNVVLGKEQTIEMVMAGVLANGNIYSKIFQV